DLHIHDLDMLAGYCAGWSLRTLLTEGFNGVLGKVEAGPPKRLSSAIGQIVNFLGTLQNEWAGAQAFSSFDTYMAPFIRKDGLGYAEVRQAMQELIFNLNVPSRWGTQTPFTNLTFDWVCPEDLRDQVPVIGGQPMNFTYGALQAEMDMINRAYIEVMARGDEKGRVFTFPIPTYNITPDFPWDSENAKLLFAMTAKYGLPYFQNFLNSDLKPNMVRSMCCRLQLDLTELLKRGNGLFGSAEQTGSLGVVTVNCARLG
ncbi:anaerobic ribonucleoside-triphosphate reductase, partial [Paracoccus sp. FO-3]